MFFSLLLLLARSLFHLQMWLLLWRPRPLLPLLRQWLSLFHQCFHLTRMWLLLWPVQQPLPLRQLRLLLSLYCQSILNLLGLVLLLSFSLMRQLWLWRRQPLFVSLYRQPIRDLLEPVLLPSFSLVQQPSPLQQRPLLPLLALYPFHRSFATTPSSPFLLHSGFSLSIYLLRR